ncbi:hypothetical protein TorRG33x02_044520 [Trema orientale]|uniref:Uncharacterized protein n=1 Tax=Trema orientale TaxID=63057 RepID=A0A2P5FPE3_TREOI|nr:hypothetical protein TorRG33x02_044520 [Trema orientale]
MAAEVAVVEGELEDEVGGGQEDGAEVAVVEGELEDEVVEWMAEVAVEGTDDLELEALVLVEAAEKGDRGEEGKMGNCCFGMPFWCIVSIYKYGS